MTNEEMTDHIKPILNAQKFAHNDLLLNDIFFEQQPHVQLPINKLRAKPIEPDTKLSDEDFYSFSILPPIDFTKKVLPHVVTPVFNFEKYTP